MPFIFPFKYIPLFSFSFLKSRSSLPFGGKPTPPALAHSPYCSACSWEAIYMEGSPCPHREGNSLGGFITHTSLFFLPALKLFPVATSCRRGLRKNIRKPPPQHIHPCLSQGHLQSFDIFSPVDSLAAKASFKRQSSLSRKETISSMAKEQNYPFGKTAPRQA